MHDVIVVGAGISGLRCARLLSESGRDVLVLDRGAKPGGRCATRMVDGQVADYGPVFLHCTNGALASAIMEMGDDQLIEGWPFRVHGDGHPCQPAAFSPGEKRFAFKTGVNALPVALSRGLAIRLETKVHHIEIARHEPRAVALVTDGGERLLCRDLVISLALEQSLELLATLPAGSDRDGILALGSLFASAPCLTVIAVYEENCPLPEWDISYPEADEALMLVSNETSKRVGPGPHTMVFQANARWSHQWFNRDRSEWERAVLANAGRRIGSWAATPRKTHLHRWRYSRLDRSNELTGPVLLAMADCRIGLAGDLFSPGGGIQAAWESGTRLAGSLGA